MWGSFEIMFGFGLYLLRMCLDVRRIATGFGHSGRMTDSCPEESPKNQYQHWALIINWAGEEEKERT